MEEGNIIDNLEQDQRDVSNSGLVNQAVSSIYGGQQDSNLIVYQLELDNILERIEHLLRGDILVTDENGSVNYEKPKEKSLIILNDYGVQLVMNVINFYLNRNTVLSNFSEERIFQILYDLGIELADLIWINYEVMGMDTMEKKSRYPILVMNILNTIESTYNRSLHGGERESLRSARVVTQNDPMGRQMQPQQIMGQSRNRTKWFNPFTWGR